MVHTLGSGQVERVAGYSITGVAVVRCSFICRRCCIPPSFGFLCAAHSTWTTLLSLLPSTIQLLRKPAASAFLWALFNTSMSFFLFSFQVHEKSILFPMLPIQMMLDSDPLFFGMLQTVASFRYVECFVLQRHVV